MYMKFFLLFFLSVLFPLALFSQITESFDDGNFTANPQWYGDTSKFEILTPVLSGDGSINATANADSLVLRSKQNESDAILVTVSTQSYGEWRFSVADGQNWSVSSTNDYKIILMSDDSTITNLTDGQHNFNGYFLQFDGGNSDMFTLYRQTGATSTAILNTNYPATIDGNTAVGRTVKIIRTTNGDWSIFIDEGFDSEPLTQRGGIVNDNTHTNSAWFGIATNIANPGTARVLFFDNLYIGQIIQDTISPVVQNVEATNANILDIRFSESVEDTTAENIFNYSVNNGIGNPDSAVIDINSASLVHLYFSAGFPLAQQNIITIQNVEDINNNVIIDTSINFMYYVISNNDIVINEIMADPVPAVALPEYEYIELYNTTGIDLSLTNWKLSVSTSTKTIPDITIPANGYYILCSDAVANIFSSYGNTAGIVSFPALTNSGTTINILDENDSIISGVTYSDQWYQDASKTGGGWSLEKIDPGNNCGGISNWKASVSNTGGTPGQQNSVFASNIDTIEPFLEEVTVVSSSQIYITFSEPVNIATLLTTSISIDQNIGNPVFIEQDPNNEKGFNLYLMNVLTSENIYHITVNNIEDDCGNILTQQTLQFAYYQPKQFDIVINEIMADPSPSVALPEYEYIEIFNRSGFSINLKDWIIKIGNTNRVFPSYVLDSYNYLILTSDEAYSSFQSYGNTINILGLSDLNNSSETITIFDNSGNIIYSIEYSDQWYKNSYKAEGGWSLEQIDYDNTCEGYYNWMASTDNKGGTPGKENSVFASNPDLDAPQLVRVAVLSDDSIKLFFNETFDTLSVADISFYNVNNGIGQAVSVEPVEPDYNKVILKFQNSFQKGIIYTLTVSGNITDCAGNPVNSNNSCKFALPDSAIKNDIAINEVLFNPYPDGVDFIEFINVSDKVLDLANIKVASRDLDTYEINNIKTICNENYLIFPGEYYLVSTNSKIIQEQYYSSNPNGFIDINSMPAMSDKEGYIMFIDKWENIIDEFHYYEDMHFSLLGDFEGVSLERINYNRPSDDKTNWHSAAETAGFATPAYENSQYSEEENSDNTILINPEIFSPDNDGSDDVLNIEYMLDEPGYVANIIIFDARGRTIRHLARNKLLGITGTISWDGLTDGNTKAKIGIYAIYVEIFDLQGKVRKYKKTCVLATKFYK